MALILDTNAFSAFVEGDRMLHKLIRDESELALPVIVLGEYLFGVRASRYRMRYVKWLEDNLRLFDVLPIGIGTSQQYAEVRSELKSAGKPIPSNDLWIASLARQHGYAVVSRDQHFRAVPNLKLFTW